MNVTQNPEGRWLIAPGGTMSLHAARATAAMLNGEPPPQPEPEAEPKARERMVRGPAFLVSREMRDWLKAQPEPESLVVRIALDALRKQRDAGSGSGQSQTDDGNGG